MLHIVPCARVWCYCKHASVTTMRRGKKPLLRANMPPAAEWYNNIMLLYTLTKDLTNRDKICGPAVYRV